MKKPKSKYTVRADGRIVLTEVIQGTKRYFYGHTDKECEEKRKAFLEALQAAEQAKLKFDHFADLWWEHKEPTLSPNSVGNFRTALQRNRDEFGSRPVAEISPREIYAFLARFAAKDYSAKVGNMAKLVCSQILDEAFIAGVISSNPVKMLPTVKYKAATPRAAASTDDLKLITEHRNDSMIARMHFFMMLTGCRRGEAMALQEKHIDRKNQTAQIIQSVAYGKSAPTVKAPKTAAGMRTVYLIDVLLDSLPRYEDPETYIFFPEGLPKQKQLETDLKSFQDSIGLSCTAHQLRHSYASMLHAAGVDVKDAQALLGHADIAVTQNIYTHTDDEQLRTAIKKFDEYVKTQKLSQELSKAE